MKRKKEVESGEDLDDIQWLKTKYREVLDREKKLLEYLLKMLGDFDYRIKIIERKLGRVNQP